MILSNMSQRSVEPIGCFSRQSNFYSSSSRTSCAYRFEMTQFNAFTVRGYALRVRQRVKLHFLELTRRMS